MFDILVIGSQILIAIGILSLWAIYMRHRDEEEERREQERQDEATKFIDDLKNETRM